MHEPSLGQRTGQLRFQVFDIGKRLLAKAVLAAELVFWNTLAGTDVTPGAVRVVDSEEIRVACE